MCDLRRSLPIACWPLRFGLPRSIAADGFVLFLDEKNQKSSQQRGFFALTAFARQFR
jgi:hypothetical protein